MLTRLAELTVVDQPLVITANSAGFQVATAPANTKGCLIALTITSPGSAWRLQIFDGTSAAGRLLFDDTGLTAGTFFLFSPYENGLFVIASGTTPGVAALVLGTQ